jgi:hypothetical protein
MKKNAREELRKVEEALEAAHRSRRESGTNDAFGRDVMLDVRRIGRLPAGDLGPEAAESRVVWGFATATCLVALLVFVYAFSMDLSGVQIELAGVLLGDPPEFEIAQSILFI